MTDEFVGLDHAQAQMEAVKREFMREFHARLEEMCEKALQDGAKGVLITWTSPTSCTYELSHHVPYGAIWEVREDGWLRGWRHQPE